jgi:hypothetical protein
LRIFEVWQSTLAQVCNKLLVLAEWGRVLLAHKVAEDVRIVLLKFQSLDKHTKHSGLLGGIGL